MPAVTGFASCLPDLEVLKDRGSLGGAGRDAIPTSCAVLRKPKLVVAELFRGAVSVSDPPQTRHANGTGPATDR
jgi:hypothetical protein